MGRVYSALKRAPLHFRLVGLPPFLSLSLSLSLFLSLDFSMHVLAVDSAGMPYVRYLWYASRKKKTAMGQSCDVCTCEISKRGICEIQRIFSFDTDPRSFNERELYCGISFSFLSSFYLFLPFPLTFVKFHIFLHFYYLRDTLTLD